MPAAAVTPAPIAYIKVVAVKKLVVGFLVVLAWPIDLVSFVLVLVGHPSGERHCPLLGWWWQSRSFTLKKLECSRQALCHE